MMTAFSTAGMTAEAEQLGAYCVMTKPMDMDQLPTLVAQASSARSAGAERPVP